MNLSSRLGRLERAAGHAAALRPCAACGGSAGEPERFVFLPIDLDETPPLPGPESCPRCGRRLLVRLGPIALDEPG